MADNTDRGHPAPDRAHRDHRTDRGARPTGPVRFRRLVNIAGALTSLALIVGLAAWAYQLAVRDVSGVPVIRALEGPARVAPDNPGGELARHTGLSVNSVAAEGAAAAPADRLALAPRPDDLGDEAPPMADLRVVPEAEAPEAVVTEAPAQAVIEAAVPAPVAAATPEATPGATSDAEAADAGSAEPETTSPANLAADYDPEAEAALRAVALADSLARGGQPLNPPDGPVDGAAAPTEAPPESPANAPDVADTAASAAAISADVSGVARSPRPPARAGGLATTAPAPAAQAPALDAAVVTALAPQAVDGVREVDPASLAPGTKLAQLGAYDDVETARREWETISARVGTLMDGKGRVIQQAVSAGRKFYRLRAEGFTDMADTRRFCAALLAKDTSCIATQVD